MMRRRRPVAVGRPLFGVGCTARDLSAIDQLLQRVDGD